jgi:TonB family protein
LFLDKETFFTHNRIYLLCSALFSLVIPFLRLEWFSTAIVNEQIHIGVGRLNGVLELVAVEQSSQLSWGNAAVLIYLFGVVFCLTKLGVQLLVVRRLLQSSQTGMAFSFFRIRRIDPALPCLQVIEKHEDIHIRQLHSADIVFFELLTALVWFNPVIYLYKSTIRYVHEFLADEKAAQLQGDKQEYVMLILSKALGVSQIPITNSFFNQSLIKKRIYMLHKQRSTKAAIMKYGLFLPLFALALTLSSATISDSKVLKAVVAEIPTDNPVEAVTQALTPAAARKEKINESAGEKVSSLIKNDQDTLKVMDFVSVDRQPGFPGGMKKFYEYLGESMKYPAEALKNKIQGKVFLSYIVEKDGKLSNIKVERALGGGTDEEAVRVLRESPKWTPGMIDGKPVRVKYNIPISFSLAKKP